MLIFNLKIFISLFIAILPPALLVHYMTGKTESNKKQKRIIFTLYLLGIILTIPILSLEFLLGRIEASFGFSLLLSQFLKAFLIVGLCEEFSKGIIVYVFAYKRIEFDQFIDGVVFAITVSMGLATFENLLYLLNGGVGIALLRTFTAVPMHAISAGILGYYISRAKFSNSRNDARKFLLKGVFFASIIHGLYDFILSSNPDLYLYASIGAYLLLILISIVLFNKIKSANNKDIKMRKAELVSEAI
ncbi:PrsW family intramembrane metalloprotease, partial [candidate division KSB1 bacterium]|nr:PrsW family intramembrane metalloprotease [candidate division KSB1 bacterium]